MWLWTTCIITVNKSGKVQISAIEFCILPGLGYLLLANTTLLPQS
jgi:hypothetical protein